MLPELDHDLDLAPLTRREQSVTITLLYLCGSLVVLLLMSL